jgi:hypothetical protein
MNAANVIPLQPSWDRKMEFVRNWKSSTRKGVANMVPFAFVRVDFGDSC